MFTVLLWKEYREQRVVWAALAFVAAAALLFMPFVIAPGGLAIHPEGRGDLRGVLIVLAGAYGLICGVLLLAGEREVGTLPFLDGLPGLRWRLWLAKCLAGLLFVLGQILLLMVLATATHLFTDGTEAAWTLKAMFGSGLYGFAWGMLFSSFGNSVMNMILLAPVAQIVSLLILTPFAGFLVAAFGPPTGQLPADDPVRFWVPVAVGVALLTIVPALAGSAFIFTRVNRGVLQPPRRVVSVTKPTDAGWRSLIWLTLREARGFALGMALLGLLSGILIPLMGCLVWPAATLVVGMLCGVTAFAGEQQEPFRSLGAQRLPLLRLWLVKVGVQLGVALTAAAIMVMPVFVLATVNPYLISHAYGGLTHTSGAGLFLSMGLVYGFCVGVLCGLLFRSILASAAAAFFLSILLAAIWLPSLLASGLHLWQPLGPPLLLFAGTPLLLRPWAASRIASWTTAKRLTLFVVLAGLWIVSGIAYRVLEIPNIPAKADLAAVRASLPTPEENKAGELVRSACLHYSDLALKLFYERNYEGQLRDIRAAKSSPGGRIDQVLDHGWSPNDTELAVWLDKILAGDWLEMLKEAAKLPPGMVENMRNFTDTGDIPATAVSVDAAKALAARGLQRQAAGDDDAFVEDFHIGLKLSLSMRHLAPTLDVQYGRMIEVVLLKALDRWLERLHGRSDLIQRALGFLSDYQGASAEVDNDQDLMQDIMRLNTVKEPLPLLQSSLSVVARDPSAPAPDVQAEARWVALSWLVPWEQKRQQRILSVLCWGGDKEWRRLASVIGPLWWTVPVPIKPDALANAAHERAALLKLALRWYQADHGKPALNLDELIPKYLPSIPLDPYDDKPFRYRLSHSEEIMWPAGTDANPPTPIAKKIPRGQGILWSVGQNHVDDGGHQQEGPSNAPSAPGEDLIFLVPLPPKAK